MLKFGIYKPAQLRDNKNFKTVLGQDKNISITLYDQLVQETEADAIAERMLLSFSDERGAYKRTYQKRFEEFDHKVLMYLNTVFATEEPFVFHDVSVSDGRTALDFFGKIASSFPRVHYIASDYNPRIYVIEKGKCKVTLSHTGKILEILFPPFVFNTIKRDSIKRYPLNYLVKSALESLVVPSLLKRYKSGDLQARELLIFAPHVLNAARNDSRFILQQHDLLTPFHKPAHIIRAMNVLNPSYFSETEFVKILRHIHEGLQGHGIFITGSNQAAGSVVHGGVYQKSQKGFKEIERSGEGSPIARFIQQFQQ